MSSHSARTGGGAQDYDASDEGKPKEVLASIELEISCETRSFEMKIDSAKKNLRAWEHRSNRNRSIEERRSVGRRGTRAHGCG